MKTSKISAAMRLSVCVCAAALATMPALAGQKHKGSAKGGGEKAAVLSAVEKFEKAYQKQDKKAMLMKLMVPTTDAGTLEKRYQWLRGYGPKDLAGSKHPPILFETSKGSFVPSEYKVTSSAPSNGSWNVGVEEKGSYKDEDGKYKVTRKRLVKVTKYKGSWYISDYVLRENPEDYGFYCDDIIDTMKPVGK